MAYYSSTILNNGCVRTGRDALSNRFVGNYVLLFAENTDHLAY